MSAFDPKRTSGLGPGGVCIVAERQDIEANPARAALPFDVQVDTIMSKCADAMAAAEGMGEEPLRSRLYRNMVQQMVLGAHKNIAAKQHNDMLREHQAWVKEQNAEIAKRNAELAAERAAMTPEEKAEQEEIKRLQRKLYLQQLRKAVGESNAH